MGLVPLMSAAMPYAEYARTCPPDLKDLGLFEVTSRLMLRVTTALLDTALLFTTARLVTTALLLY